MRFVSDANDFSEEDFKFIKSSLLNRDGILSADILGFVGLATVVGFLLSKNL